MARCAALVNVMSFSHPHVRSLFSEGLWGFPDNAINRKRWLCLEEGSIIFFYGNYNNNRGVYLKGVLNAKFEDQRPVSYWVQNPTGYPLQIRADVVGKLEEAVPILRGELAELGVRMLKATADRWSLLVFGDVEGATYGLEVFRRIEENFEIRNVKAPPKVDHDAAKEILYKIGLLQGKVSLKEIELDGYKIDVAWKKIPKEEAKPYISFEVHIHGNLEEALTKLKHANDMWNSKPILVTTKDQVGKAYNIASGAFHEIADELKIITLEDVKNLYDKKKEFKDFESRLGLH